MDIVSTTKTNSSTHINKIYSLHASVWF